jgi:hypothetical protein
MRKTGVSSILCLLFMALPALAQNVEPENVKLDEAAPGNPTSAAPAPAKPTAAVAPAKLAAPSAAAVEDQEKAKKPEDTRAATGSVSGPVTEGDDTWKFGYNGFFRAPMRVGMSSRQAAPGQSSTTFHAPLVPDDQYLSWQHTKHANRDWAELFFSYGNSWAKGVIAVQGYNFVDSAYADPKANFGIGQGWIEITPYMPAENMRFKMKAGSFWNRYGGAGRWDAGEYDTHVIGRTHVMGETARLEIDIEGQPLTLGFEHGIGTKKPDPSIYNTARFTLLHHAHVDMMYDQSISFGLHFLNAWSQSEPPVTGPQPSWVYPSPYASRYQGINQPDGDMKVFGAEARFDMPDVFGYFYLGGSYITAKNAVTVAPAIEVIHSSGGGEYNMGITGNYLDSEICRWGANASAQVTCSNGNGSVMSLMGQYEQKVGDLLGESPFGEGQDLTVKLYGMWNKVKSDDKTADGNSKLKFGTDLFFDVFPVMAVATRFDYLMPNSRYKQQNFGVLSPRIVLRSSFVTHEQISFQYSRYLYSKRTCDVGTPADNPIAGINDDRAGTPFPNGGGYPYGAAPPQGDWSVEASCVQPPPSTVAPDGFGSTTQSQSGNVRGIPYTRAHLRPDVNVFAIEASMWW